MSGPRRWLVWALGLLLLGSVAVAGLRVGKRGRFSSPYSTYGAGPDGTRALLRLSQELGFEARPLGRELTHLRRGTLVAIGGCRGGMVRDLVRPEREELLRWVEAGGLLIVAGVNDFAPKESGLKLDAHATCQSEDEKNWLDDAFDESTESDPNRVPLEIEAAPSGPPLAHAKPFTVERARTVRVAAGNEATAILDSELGPLGLTAPLGRGRVVLLGIPEALTNRGLPQGGAVVFSRLLQAFAPKGPVWFDEYHLGMGERRSLVRYLRDRGYGALLGQLALVVLVALLAQGVRLGRARREWSSPKLGARHHLSALGALYVQSGDARGALEVTARHALQRIARRYRAHDVSPRELPAWLDDAGFHAAATCARRIHEHAEKPLAPRESLLGRALEIEQDASFALALGDLT